MTRNELLETMLSLSNEIHSIRELIITTKREIARINVLLRQIKIKYLILVNNSIDTNGKPIYSNPEKRANEVATRLDKDPLYTSEQNKLLNYTTTVEDLELQMSKQSYIFRAYESFASFNE